MKKLIAAAVLVAAVAAQAAIQGVGPYNWRTATESQFREVLNAMLAQTNAANCFAVSCASLTNASWSAIMYRKDLDGLRLESDIALADKGFAMWWQYPHTWPRISAAYRTKYGFEARLSTCLALAAKYAADINPGAFQRSGATVGELAACLGEVSLVASTQPVLDISFIDAFKKQIQYTATKGVRRALRSQGKSFVTKNGVNPCEQYMSRLTAALNAPRFDGLNEWLAELGIEGRVDLSALPSKSEVNKLVDDIMNGDMEMRRNHRALLYVCLGVDGYNAFVKEYNGDEE